MRLLVICGNVRISLNWAEKKILSVSPQGLDSEEYCFQNLYQSGYFVLQNGAVKAENFREWDMGFDFYAPQTFEDANGRRKSGTSSF